MLRVDSVSVLVLGEQVTVGREGERGRMAESARDVVDTVTLGEQKRANGHTCQSVFVHASASGCASVAGSPVGARNEHVVGRRPAASPPGVIRTTPGVGYGIGDAGG